MFKTSKMTLSALCLLGGVAFVPAASMAATKAGTYSGPAADGSTVSFDVAVDPNNSSQFVVTGASFGYNATCKGDTSVSGGWGTGGFSTPITGGHATFTAAFTFFYVNAKIFFNGDQGSGTISNAEPDLISTDNKTPHKVLLCKQAPQKFTLTYSAPTAAVAAAKVASKPYAVPLPQ